MPVAFVETVLNRCNTSAALNVVPRCLRMVLRAMLKLMILLSEIGYEVNCTISIWIAHEGLLT